MKEANHSRKGGTVAGGKRKRTHRKAAAFLKFKNKICIVT